MLKTGKFLTVLAAIFLSVACLSALEKTADSTVAAVVSKKSSDAIAQVSGDFYDAPFRGDSVGRLAEYSKAVLRSASGSIASGMPALAQSIISEYVAKVGSEADMDDALRAVYIDALIAQGNFELASKQCSLLKSDVDSVRNRIRRALISVGLNNSGEAMKALEAIDIKKISDADISWYHLARGYALFESANLTDALKEFEEAKKLAKSDFAIADTEIAINICRLSEDFKGGNLPEIEKELAEKVRFYMGTPAGFQFAKQYASVLYKVGKTEEALEVLDQQLGIQLAQEIDKDELKVIAAVMTKNTEKQSVMLREILKTTASVGVAEYAIALLSRNSESSPEEFENFLDEVVGAGSSRIRDRILLETAKIGIKRGNRDRAAATALRIIEDFPASRYKADALRILAWAACSTENNKAPEYRLAASYLSTLADIEKDRTRALNVRMLSADCYYLNKDYSTAAKIYRQLFDEMPEERGALLNRAVEAYILLDDIDSASKLLDGAYRTEGVGDNDLWNADWKLISKYREQGDNRKAIERVERSISSTQKESEMLRLRMMWLRALMTQEDSDSEKTIALCDDILKEIKNTKSSDKNLLEQIAANTMLMKARCFDALGKGDIAVEIYRDLLKEYPLSQAAQLSFLYQARVAAMQMKYALAQQICQTLIDTYPQGKYRYSAMLDAAHYARMMGLEQNYKAALAILDKVCADYPDDPRNFYARLSQAEILRLLNAFADARSLYNDIIKKYPAHPEISLALLGLGDSSLAQLTRSLDAAAIFERIYYLPEMPIAVRAEAAFKWSFALERADRMREANEVRWMTSQKILDDKSALKGSAGVAYWTARSLFALAKSLEDKGEMRDARSAYDLIVKYKLPSYSAAERKLKNMAQ